MKVVNSKQTNSGGMEARPPGPHEEKFFLWEKKKNSHGVRCE